MPKLKNRTDRISGLDGLRAISIVLVIAFHLTFGRNVAWLGPIGGVLNYGFVGVTVFFVLSGYLITWLLLQEEQLRGRIDLRAFYLRRAIRILPPALAYLAVLSALSVAGVVTVSAGDITKATLFVRNITSGPSETGHFWSLAVEEQFYLLWPAAFYWMSGYRYRLILTVGLVIAAPFWRQVVFLLAGGAMHVNGWRFDLRYDALLTGCVLALLRYDGRGIKVLNSGVFQNPAVPIISTATVYTFTSLTMVPKPLYFLSASITHISIALVINYVIEARGSWLVRLLNSTPLATCGALSYSLYIWQQLFCVNPDGSTAWYKMFPMNFALTVAAAVLSYRLIERPLAQYRKRLTVRHARVERQPLVNLAQDYKILT